MAIPILAAFGRAALSSAGRGALGGATGSRTAGSLLSGFGDSFQRGWNQGANLLDGALRRSAEVANNQFLPMLRDILPAGMGKLAESTIALTNTFVARGKELEQYSGLLSGTNAINDVKTILADIKEAQTMEDSLSRISQSQNDIWLNIREILLPIKEAMATLLADGLETVLTFLEFMKPLMQKLGEAAVIVIKCVPVLVPVVGIAMAVADLMKDVEENTRKKDEIKDLPKAMFNQMIDGALKNLNRNAPQMPQNDGGLLNLPAFGF
jgi:hypothetical protein